MTIEADGSVAAHIEEADVVKEDDAGLARRVVRFAEQRADNGVVTARLVDHGGADVIEVGAKAVEAFLDWAAAEIGAAGDDDARGFAAGVGIDYVDPMSYRAKVLIGEHHQLLLRDAARGFFVPGQDRFRHFDMRLRRIHHVDIQVAAQVADEQKRQQRR